MKIVVTAAIALTIFAMPAFAQSFDPELGAGNVRNGAVYGGAEGAYAQATYPYPVDTYEWGAYGDASGNCVRRFRSYDFASGTYLGYDGRRHSCP